MTLVSEGCPRGPGGLRFVPETTFPNPRPQDVPMGPSFLRLHFGGTVKIVDEILPLSTTRVSIFISPWETGLGYGWKGQGSGPWPVHRRDLGRTEPTTRIPLVLSVRRASSLSEFGEPSGPAHPSSTPSPEESSDHQGTCLEDWVSERVWGSRGI